MTINSLAFSPDGNILAAGVNFLYRTPVILWRVSNFALLNPLKINSGLHSGNDPTFSPDGNKLAALVDGMVNIWRVSDGVLLFTLGEQENRVLAFSPDGTMVASIQSNGTIQLWQVSDGTLVRAINGLDEGGFIAFSPDGRLLASGSADGTIHLWGVQ